jgi:hypothetical protein
MDQKIIKHHKTKKNFMAIEIYLLFLKFLFLNKNISNLNLYFFFEKNLIIIIFFFVTEIFVLLRVDLKKFLGFVSFQELK